MSPLPPPPSGSPGPRWNPQVIGLVGLICSIFLLFSYYKILERNCVIFRVTRRNAASSQRRRLNQEELSSSGQLQHSRGLDSYVMHSLPITQTKDEEGAECAVCLGEFQEDEWVKHLPICSHVFHVSCIDTWFQTHSSCPLCRSYVCASMDVNLFLQTLSREDFNRQRSPQQRNSSTQVVQVRVDPHPTQ